MFDAMMRMVVEQQDLDGAVRHREFDPPPSVANMSDDVRMELIASIEASIPDHLKYHTADGRTGIVYFDTRGRAVAAVPHDMDDDTLVWVSETKNMNSGAPSGGRGYTQPVEEAFDPKRLTKPTELARLLKKAGTSRKETGLRLAKHHDVSEQEIKSILTRFWGKEKEEVSESTKLSAKSRTAIEKFVYAKFPPDSKTKKSGKMQVMMTGEAAKVTGAKEYSRLDLASIETGKLLALAKLLGYSGAIERIDEDLMRGKVLGTPFLKFAAGVEKALTSDGMAPTKWEPRMAGNVQMTIDMTVNGKAITLVVRGEKPYNSNSASPRPTNSWIDMDGKKIWGGASIKKSMAAIRQALGAEEKP